MPPDPKPEPPGTPAPDSTLDSRMSAVETEQQRQGGILERIEQALAGSKTPAKSDPAPDGKPIAELVREGVEQLRREEQAKADADADRAQRDDHAARLAALEERPPSETAATPAGRVRSAIQKWGFGVDQPRK